MEFKLIEDFLIAKIKSKKELSSVDDAHVQKLLTDKLKKYTKDLEKYSSTKQFQRSQIFKELVSLIRGELREIYGVFIKNPLTKYKNKLNKLETFDDSVMDEILSSHQSSYERQTYYHNLYDYLFELLFSQGLSKKFSLVDLACGFNPFAYKYLPLKPTNYFASDISTQDMDLINLFFEKTNIKGQAKALDLTDINSFEKINDGKPFDVCFLFKALDSLETKSRHISKKLIANLNCKFFIVSFPKVTIGGKNTISSSKRSWFEKFVQKEFNEFVKYELPNEVFYIFKKD